MLGGIALYAHALILSLSKDKSACAPPSIIIGLSGGPDSVFLLHVLTILHQEKKINLIAAHLNHGWRKESDSDAQFCIDLCQKLNIPIVVKHARDLASPCYNGSLEEVGRNLRRSFFTLLLQEHNAICIALAHHRQDQQETFLMRLMRGSSLSGLCCMKEIDASYIRPLLHVNKKDIVSYLDTYAITYCIDHTNQSPQFLRNRIRHTVLEPLRAVDGRCDEKFDTTVSLLQEEDAYLNRLTYEQFALIFTKNTENIWLCDVKKFIQCDPVLQRRLLMYWFIQEKIFFPVSHAFMQEVIRFLISSRGGTHHILHNIIIFKKSNVCWIVRR